LIGKGIRNINRERTILIKIIFSNQVDEDKIIIPLWYHWYTNIFKADKLLVLGASVKGTTHTDWVRNFYKDKTNVIYSEKEYNYWHFPSVWEDQVSIVESHIPSNENYYTLIADCDEFFEPVEDCVLEHSRYIAYKQLRLGALEQLSLGNIMGADIFTIPNIKDGLIVYKSTPIRCGLVNDIKNLFVVPGVARGSKFSGLYFFHLHFMGLNWYVKRFKNMRYPTGRSSYHWKIYTKNIQERLLKAKYDEFLNDIDRSQNIELIKRFKGYFE